MATVIVLAIVLGWIYMAVKKVKKNGCCGGCSGCGGSCNCHK